jgi:MFS superfamily sulfate permease-like transporter
MMTFMAVTSIAVVSGIVIGLLTAEFQFVMEKRNRDNIAKARANETEEERNRRIYKCTPSI